MATRKPYIAQPAQTVDYDAMMANLNGLPGATPEQAPSRGLLRGAADLGLEAASGAAKGIKFMSDVFGADNPVSQGLQGVSDFAKELQSAQARGEDQRIAQLMKEAEDKGIGEQVKAALRAAGEAPVRQAIGAIGTSVPMIAASMVPGLREASWGTRAAALGGMGGAQGVGVVKSSMYDAVYQRAIEEGRSEQEARALAQQAQAYSPENAGDIALGGALGVGAALTGFEPAAARAVGGAAAKAAASKTAQRGLMQSTLRGTLAEAIPEATQGFQEQVAGNRAEQRAGFDTPTFRGAAGSATLEGLLSAPGGAVGGMLDARGAKPAPKLLADQIRATESVPETGPMTRAANQAVEAKAQQVEMTAGAESAALTAIEKQAQDDLQGLRDFAGRSPDVVAGMPAAGAQSVAPGADPSAEFIDSPFLDRIQTVQEMLADPATREKVRARWGDEGLNNIAYYAGMANRTSLPEKTQDNLLGMAERLLSESVLAPIQPTPELDGMRRDPLTLGNQPQPATPALGMDGTPSGRFTVDPQGNVSPESRAQRGDAQRRADEIDSLGRQTPRGQAQPEATMQGALGIGMDTAPTGRLLAGQDGVRPETRMDAINIGQADMQRQAEAAQRAEMGLTPDIEAVQQRNAMRPQDGDILNPSGKPFKTLMAAQRAAKKNPGEVVEVAGGFAIRPVQQPQAAAPSLVVKNPETGEDIPVQSVDDAAAKYSELVQRTGADREAGIDVYDANTMQVVANVKNDGTAAPVETREQALARSEAQAAEILRQQREATPMVKPAQGDAGQDQRVGREGYDTPIELDAAQLKTILEKTRGEPLATKPAKLEAWRNGTAKTDPNKYPVELAFTTDGRLDVNDGRHRIALAAERGEKVTAFIDGKDAQRAQELLANVQNLPQPTAAQAPADQAPEAARGDGAAPAGVPEQGGVAAAVEAVGVEQQPTPNAEPANDAQQDEAPFTHAGLKIKTQRIKVGDGVETRWVVQTPENAEREARGERQIGGDRIVDSREQAIQVAEEEVARDADDKARKAAIDAERKVQADAEEARKAANRGKTVAERRSSAILDKQAKLPTSLGLGNGSRRQTMENAVEQGRAIVAAQVRDDTAKRRDEAIVATAKRAGYMLGLSNENIPVVKAALEADKRLKANDYQKTEYRVYSGSDTTRDSFAEISKTEFDYAQELLAKRDVNPEQDKPAAAKDRKLESLIKIAADSVEQLRKADVDRVLNEAPQESRSALAKYISAQRPDLAGEVADVMQEAKQSAQEAQAKDGLPEGWKSGINGFTKRPFYRKDQDGGLPFAVVQRTDIGYDVQIRLGDKLLNEQGLTGAAKFEALTKADEMLASQSVHKDLGQPAETVTQPVIQAAMKKAARNEDTKPSEMRTWLLGEIDKALQQAPDLADYDATVKRVGEKDAVSMFTGGGLLGKNSETGYVTFDVPGDGTFKVRNSVRGLLEFKRKVAASPGFKDRGQDRVRPEEADSVRRGSGGLMSAITNMIEEGDFEAARDYAEAVGVKLEDVKAPKGTETRWKAFVKDGTLPAKAPATQFPANIDVESFEREFPEFKGYGITQITLKQNDIDFKSRDTIDNYVTLNKYTQRDFVNAYTAGKLSKAADRQADATKAEVAPAPAASTFPYTSQQIASAYAQAESAIRGKAWSANADSTHKGRIRLRLKDMGMSEQDAQALLDRAATIQAGEMAGMRGAMMFLRLKDLQRAAIYRGLVEEPAADPAPQPATQEQAAEAPADVPKLTQAEAAQLMEWQDMGQKNGVKTHALRFYASQADKDAKRGIMTLITVSKGDVSDKAWTVDGDDQKFGMLAQAKKRGMELGMARAVKDGFVGAAEGRAVVSTANDKLIGKDINGNDVFMGTDGPLKGVPYYFDERGQVRTGVALADQTPQPATKATEEKPAGKVENFGEQLPPARRAMAAKLSELLDDDTIAAQPLSKIWPIEENEAIEDTFAAAVAHVMREAIPAKPRKGYKLNGWVEKVKMLREFAARILRGGITKESFLDQMGKYSTLRDMQSKVKLLEQIDRADWKRIGEVAERPNALRFENGNSVPSPSVSIAIDGKPHWLRNSGDLNDHMEAIKSMLQSDAPETRMKFEIRQERGGKVFINKAGDKQFHRLLEFDTVAEARKAMDERYADLVSAWDEVKSRENITERDLRTAENRPRTGKDHRNGRDITAEEFQQQFGFRGGEFGKWVSQGKGAQERQFMLNSAYDALMDLADIVGVPPKAISLNGTLGIAFGSRGGGWASAHFEPSNLVINLTKPRGAGALAHEWFHALDNYFARQRNDGKETMPSTFGPGAQDAYRRSNYITHKTGALMVRKDGKGSPVTKARLEEWRKTNPSSGYLDPDQWMLDPRHPQGVRVEVEERFNALVNALDNSPMLQRSRSLEGTRGDSDGYWSRPLERAARAFENYVQHRMHEQGYHNDFLVNVKPAEDTGKNPNRYPYLMPSEMAPIVEAFNDLFGTVETRETDKGVAMFSRTDRKSPGLAAAETTSIANAIAERWTNAPEIVVAADMNDAAIPQAVRDYDAKQRSLGAKGEPEGFWYDGKVYLVAKSMASPSDVMRVLFHESLGHFGLRGVFGDALDPILNQIAALRRADVQAKADEYGLDLSKPDERLQAAEEVLSVMAQTKPELGYVKRAIAAIRSWMRRTFPKLFGQMKLTDAEIIRDYILPARAFVERGAMGESAGGAAFSRGQDQTQTEAFKRWFGDSKVVNAEGRPLVVYHGSEADIMQFRSPADATGQSNAQAGLYFTSDPGLAGVYAKQQGAVYPVYLNIRNPLDLNSTSRIEGWKGAIARLIAPRLAAKVEREAGLRSGISQSLILPEERDRLEAAGYDGVKADGVWIAFRPEQIKSAIGNNGDFDPANPDIRFSRTAAAKAFVAPAMDKLNETFNHPGKLSWWHKTVGSMYNLAERMPAFKPVYDAAQNFINDVSFYAIEAADKAPRLLPRLEDWKDLAKSPITAQDNKAVAAPVFEGTLSWRRDESGKPVLVEDLAKRYASLTPEQKAQRLLRSGEISENVLKMWQGMPQEQYASSVNTAFEGRMLKAGIVFTPDELKSIFKLNDAQVALYQEFRQSIDTSLDNMGKSDLLRVAGKDAADLKDAVMAAPDVDAAAVLLRDHLLDLAKENPDRSDALVTTANDMITRADRVQRLKSEGYAPLSRFGQYTVDVVVDGERQYFSMFETVRDANRMAAKLKMEYGVENVAQGTLSQREFEMLQGITPESLELFGNMLGLDSTGNEAQDQVFQEYLKRTKANRSAMKRLIHRKGIAGYSEDVGRVLAAFVYSNARQTSAALHMGDLGEAVMAIPKGEGELKDAAVELARYVKEPREEAAKMRGWLFAQYLGGSIASAIVNFTQPLTTSAPYLSQFGGMGKSVKALYQAMADLKDKKFEAGLAESFRKRTEDGTLAPQGVHELMAQSRGEATLRTGDGTQMGDALAKGRNTVAKVMIGWGKLFGMAEQINRQSTYVAAYRMAVERGMADPDAFAKKVVDETQFVNNKANKMKFGRGAIGATLMTFKSYSLNWLELFHRLSTQNGREGKMAAAWMLGVLLLSAGASGLPFAEDAEDLADFLAQRLGYNWSSKKARQEFLEDLFGRDIAGFVENGVTGLPGAPIDVSGRLGMGNMIPGTGLFLSKKDHTSDFTEVLGPAGDLAKRTFQAGDLLLSGNVGQAALMIAPKAIGNLEKGVDMAATGMYRDARGYKVDDATTGEAIGKAIGFQPRAVAQIQEASSLNQRAKDFYRLKVERINAKWAKAIFEKDAATVDEVRAEIKEWNRQNPDQRIQANIPAILRRVKEMRKTKADRIADTAPKALRASMQEEARRMRVEQ